jgi:hypothetical protein
MHEKPADRAPIRGRRNRNQHSERETEEQHECDELDTGLTLLRGHRSSSQSRAKSTGLAQSLTIWSTPEIGTVWRGPLSG